MTDRDDAKQECKDRFARDPIPLVRALGLRVDEHNSKVPTKVLCFDGQEEKASLLIGGRPDCSGLCTRWGDDWKGDCFALVQRLRPTDSFRTRLELVASVYGVKLPDAKPRQERGEQEKVIGRHSYPVEAPTGVNVYHKRLDFEGGGKSLWWEDEEGKRQLPPEVKLADLPLWRMGDIYQHPTRPVIICEGEKDTDALCEAGLLAVGTYGADVIPSEAVLQRLIGHKVYLWPDADAVGRKHMGTIAQRLAEVGWQCYLLEWEDAPRGGGAADWFAAGKTVEELRDLAKEAKPWAIADLGDDTTLAVEQWAEDAVNAIPMPHQTRVPLSTPPRRLCDLAVEMITDFEAYRAGPRIVRGLRTGFPTLDNHYLGFARQQLIIVQGPSGFGKTLVANHCIFATALAEKARGTDELTVVFLCESTKQQLMSAYLGYRWGIPIEAREPGSEQHLTPEIEELLMRGYAEFPTLPIAVHDEVKDIGEIEAHIRTLVGECPVAGVVIDHAQEVEVPRGRSRHEELSQVAVRFRDLADKLQVPILLLSQTTQKDGEYVPEYSRGLTQKCSLSMVVTRGKPGAKRPEAIASNVTRILCDKSRHVRPLNSLTLFGDWRTGRLWEKEDYVQATGLTAEVQEESDWHDNG
jgi:hypothetical protein